MGDDAETADIFITLASINFMFLLLLLMYFGCYGRNVHDTSLYKKYVFYCHCSCAFVDMSTYSFHWFIMVKMKIGIYC